MIGNEYLTKDQETNNINNFVATIKQQIFNHLKNFLPCKIVSVDKEHQTCDIEIQIKFKSFGTEKIIEYPQITEVPFFILQGGGAFIELPIKEGDFAFFGTFSVDISKWWVEEIFEEPPTIRRHDLSDGFVIIGLNTKNGALPITNDRVAIVSNGYNIEIDSKKDGQDGDITFDSGQGTTSFTTKGYTIDSATEKIEISGMGIDIDSGASPLNLSGATINVGGDSANFTLILSDIFIPLLNTILVLISTHTHTTTSPGADTGTSATLSSIGTMITQNAVSTSSVKTKQ